MRDILEIFTQIEQLKANGMQAQAMQVQLQQMLQSVQSKMQGGAPEGSGAPEQARPANRELPEPQADISQPGPGPAPGQGVQTRMGQFEPGVAA